MRVHAGTMRADEFRAVQYSREPNPKNVINLDTKDGTTIEWSILKAVLHVLRLMGLHNRYRKELKKWGDGHGCVGEHWQDANRREDIVLTPESIARVKAIIGEMI